MDDDKLVRRVQQTISTSLGVPLEQVRLDAELEELADDSIQLFELILAFENELGESANYDDLVNIVTVGDVVQHIRTHYAHVSHDR